MTTITIPDNKEPTMATLTTTTLDYATLARMTRDRDPMIGHNTCLVGLRGGNVAVCLHRTNILTVRPDGAIVIDTGGYTTVTTKRRLNEFLRPLGANVYSKSSEWFLRTADGVEHDYFDGMTLDATGNLV